MTQTVWRLWNISKSFQSIAILKNKSIKSTRMPIAKWSYSKILQRWSNKGIVWRFLSPVSPQTRWKTSATMHNTVDNNNGGEQKMEPTRRKERNGAHTENHQNATSKMYTDSSDEYHEPWNTAYHHASRQLINMHEAKLTVPKKQQKASYESSRYTRTCESTKITEKDRNEKRFVNHTKHRS